MNRVPATLTIRGIGQPPRVEPLDVSIEARSCAGGAELSIVLNESGTEWLLELDGSAAAYISGGLALGAGVTLATTPRRGG